jgi:hypothetical protein
MYYLPRLNENTGKFIFDKRLTVTALIPKRPV